MRYQMPKIDLEKIGALVGAEDLAIIARMVNTRTGCLRASKPPVKSGEDVTGCGAYVWRHTAFLISPKREHHCMPVTDTFDLPDSVTDHGYGMSNPRLKHLHDLVDIVVDTVPVSQWHGVRRWGQAFGQIGTPRYDDGGAVIYR